MKDHIERFPETEETLIFEVRGPMGHTLTVVRAEAEFLAEWVLNWVKEGNTVSMATEEDYRACPWPEEATAGEWCTALIKHDEGEVA